MKPLPTDLEILNAIYDRYYNEFAHQADKRERKAVVEIDIPAIGQTLGVDPDIVFGRLHYHLDRHYHYETGKRLDGEPVKVRLFFNKKDYGFNGVHFPYMASALAELRAEDRRRQTQTNIAWYSLGGCPSSC